jgi:lysyl-tRNA synthetase class 1
VHWADVAANKLLERGDKHRIASGTSISGLIHIGNAGDVIYADGVARALHEKGAKAEVIWIADDVDPLRAVPEQLPSSFSEHLGKPVCALPDPDGCHKGFTDHFIEPFLTSLKALGITPIEKRGSRMYAAGEYDDAIALAFEKAEVVREILVAVAKSKKAPGWIPFDAICGNCGRIATTDALGLEGANVRYRCGGGVAGKKDMAGCGHEGTATLRQGKLTWRAEWAARWKILGVTCEPFGKEHSAAGGSYDTSEVISREVYGYPPPLPILYEYILVGGVKMSKSKGNVIPVSALLEVLPPEVVRFFFFRIDPNKHRDFDPASKLQPLAEEYERAQAIADGRTAPSPREDAEEMTRACVLSRVHASTPTAPDLVPFGHLITLAQVVKGDDALQRALLRAGFAAPQAGPAAERLHARSALARRFVERYVPPEDRFTVIEDLAQVPLARIEPPGRAYLHALASALKREAWNPEAIHNSVFETAKACGLPPKEAFGAAYLSLIGKDRGPRAGYFIASLDPTFVLRRFADVGTAK